MDHPGNASFTTAQRELHDLVEKARRARKSPRMNSSSPHRGLTITDAVVFDGESPELAHGNVTFKNGWACATADRQEGGLLNACGKVVVPGARAFRFLAGLAPTL